MYQFRWLTVSGSSESGLVSLPAKICVFFWSQAALRALTLGLFVGLAALAVTPWSSGTWFGTCVHGWKLLCGRLALDESRRHRRRHEVELVHGRQTEDLLDRPSHVDLRVVGVVGGSVLHGVWADDIAWAAMTVDVVDAVLRVVFLDEDRRRWTTRCCG